MMNFISLILIVVCVLLGTVGSSSSYKKDANHASITIDTKDIIGETDDAYICVTLDYFTFIPEDVQISIFHLDLNNTILKNAVKAFSPLRLRVGGTLEDELTYETVGQKEPCLPFAQNTTYTLFGFSKGCLSLSRWDQLNNFFNETGVEVMFGLNALYGKKVINSLAMGPWDSSNAKSLIKYSFNKGYNNLIGWELGNELSGAGVGATILADQYAKDVASLQNVLEEIYKGSNKNPIVAAPGGFFNAPAWFSEFINKTAKTLPVITHHVYNLGPGEDEHLMERALDPTFLDTLNPVFRDLQNMLKSAGSITVAWVGEAGGAWHGGRHLVTDSFVSGFWYLDQLGMAASYNTKTFCRQALIGGHYGLLNTTTFVPNPDYYSSLLWHRLMGKRVLQTKVYGPPKIRAYTLCSRQSGGITLLILNIEDKAYEISVSTQDGSITSSSKQGIKREEYHLTSPNGDYQSQTILLNGQVLSLTSSNDIPQLEPQRVDSGKPIEVAPYSYVFVQFLGIFALACKV
ncbi:heparanase-like protein 3 [Silene latifolia]|uniref:heparanase-like protein 3 n=1 Tax=Silene latifolia TaxID=37657 RepID=UPI003D77D13B